ncbi:hypothetical protein [Streptomyces sp. NPDC048527]|uniref:hypothetical protein n=1 Tax=Streptomyces sp. NPDC048527 TaxID=3365568 RepID=UPI0037245891
MGAYKSHYQTDPWQPNVDKSGKDSSVQEKAADAYSKVYGVDPTYGPADSSDPPAMVNAPELTMAWTTAPDLVPTVPPQGSGVTPPPDYTAFFVDLAAVRTAEQGFLDSTHTLQTAYEGLKQRVDASHSSQTIFGQNAGQWKFFHDNPKGSLEWEPDALAEGGVEMANSINAQMSHTLQDVAGIVESFGMFTAMLNNTAQLYTEADATSYFPDDPSVEITAGIWNILMNSAKK